MDYDLLFCVFLVSVLALIPCLQLVLVLVLVLHSILVTRPQRMPPRPD